MRRFDSLATSTLLAIARQRPGMDSARCRLVFEHLDLAESLQAALLRALAPFGLNGPQFAALVVLFAIHPEPVSMAALAEHAGVSPVVMTDVLNHLERIRFASRARDAEDRRVIRVRITAKGRRTVDQALVHLLAAAGEAARFVDAAGRKEMFGLYARLREGAVSPAPPAPAPGRKRSATARPIPPASPQPAR